MSIPCFFKFSESPTDGLIPFGPPVYMYSPTIILLSKYVPVQSITAFERYISSNSVITPLHFPSSTTMSIICACFNSRLSVFSKILLKYLWYAPLSDCARSAYTAGPLPRLSIRICIAVSSAAIPICPPSASISFTR